MPDPISGTIHDFVYRRYRDMKSEDTAFAAVTGTATGPTSTTVLIDENADFLESNIRAGDTVSNVTDAGASATVVSVDSATQITTTAVAGGAVNAWTALDDYSIAAPATCIRVGFTNRKQFVVQITGNSDHATPEVTISHGDADPHYDVDVEQNKKFELTPDDPFTGNRIIVQMTVAAAGKLNVSVERR